MTYAQKLKDPRWQKKRLEIFDRDGFECQKCSRKNRTLHVHHLYYLPETEPWEYDDPILITLCEECHKYEEYTKRHFNDLVKRLLLKGYDYGLLSCALTGLENDINLSHGERCEAIFQIADDADVLKIILYPEKK